MRTGLLRLIAVLGLSLMWTTGPLAAITAPIALAASNMSQSAAPHRYKIVVDGLACPFCAYGIEKQINGIKGVQRVQTDIASETVTVTMMPGATLNKDAAAKAVRDAGFTLHNFEEVRVSAGQ